MIDRRRSRAPFDDMRDVSSIVIGYFVAGLIGIAGLVIVGIALIGLTLGLLS